MNIPRYHLQRKSNLNKRDALKWEKNEKLFWKNMDIGSKSKPCFSKTWPISLKERNKTRLSSWRFLWPFPIFLQLALRRKSKFIQKNNFYQSFDGSSHVIIRKVCFIEFDYLTPTLSAWPLYGQMALKSILWETQILIRCTIFRRYF